jgi:hypothetical protein
MYIYIYTYMTPTRDPKHVCQKIYAVILMIVVVIAVVIMAVVIIDVVLVAVVIIGVVIIFGSSI